MFRKKKIANVLFLCVLLLAVSCSAGIGGVTTTSCGSSSHYCLIFVSSTTSLGTIDADSDGGVTDAVVDVDSYIVVFVVVAEACIILCRGAW